MRRTPPEAAGEQENLFSGSGETLEGVVEKIRYRNEETGYTVALLRPPGGGEAVVAVGRLLGVNPGESLRLKGRWSRHPKFGRQYEVESYTCLVPATAAGIERYLSSGLIKGIGPEMAKRIVARFGEETLEVIERAPERLREVPGVGPKRAEDLVGAFRAQREVREVMLFLQQHEVAPHHAARIYRQYGEGAIAVLKEDPYRLAAEVFGIGFKTADSIARRLGVPPDSPRRLEACLLYALSEFAEEGHCFAPKGRLLARVAELLEVDGEKAEAALARQAASRRVVVEEVEAPEGQGEREEAIYLPSLHLAEAGAAERLGALLRTPRPEARYGPALRELGFSGGSLPDRLSSLAGAAARGGLATEDQKRAISEALSRKVLIITGGPGTGKTTAIRAVASLYARLRRKCELAAPTGRAAKRLSEAAGREARTIHRLLEYSPQRGAFQRDADHPLDCDAAVVDEASMLDAPLLFSLLNALPDEAALTLVGDADQLPSVGPGNVLRDLLASGAIPVVRLTQLFRQAEESLIVTNAHRVNRGEMPLPGKPGPPRSEGGEGGGAEENLLDYYFIEEEDPERAASLIVELVRERIPRRFGLRPLDDIQVITPMNKGAAGAQNLNLLLQEALNPEGPSLARGGRLIRAGDRLMQLRNNYDKNVFNGDIGRAVSLDPEEGVLTVEFDGQRVVYEARELDELAHAYAVTVHKSQGSEYPAVVLPLLTQHYLLLQRNLLYTALTRARRLAVLVGSKRAVAIAVKNDKVKGRYTCLAPRLRRAGGG